MEAETRRLNEALAASEAEPVDKTQEPTTGLAALRAKDANIQELRTSLAAANAEIDRLNSQLDAERRNFSEVIASREAELAAKSMELERLERIKLQIEYAQRSGPATANELRKELPYQLGSLLVSRFEKPSLRILALPIDIFSLLRDNSKANKGGNAADD